MFLTQISPNSLTWLIPIKSLNNPLWLTFLQHPLR